jgi:sugar O-acyltransferase (sialic acid O-acetyltransferase NeuD family)
MTSLWGVFGAGGHGREVMPLARQQVTKADSHTAEVVFVVDEVQDNVVNGHRVISYAEFVRAEASRRSLAIALGDGRARERVASRLASDGITPWTIFAESAQVLDATTIAEGALISPFSIITSNVRIGRFFQANTFCAVAHDCVIGDYVTLAPGARCNGNVHVGDFAFIGSGAVIREGRPGNPVRIGAGAIVGMGAIVTRDVHPGQKVVGNPARPMDRRDHT